MKSLLSGATTSAAGLEMDVEAGKALMLVWGVFDGATVAIQIKASDGTWITIDNGSFTSAGVRSIEFTPCKVRALVSGAGVNTSLNSEIRQSFNY